MVTKETIIMAEPPTESSSLPAPIERVQTGVRMEKRMLKVLKALAEYHDFSLGELLEGIVLHAFENKPPFSPETLQKIAQLKAVYGMDYDARASHRLAEENI
jgi:hypothetical protein